MRQNDLRDTIATLLDEVCNDVTTEPCLQHLSGETLRPLSANTLDGARIVIWARGFWDVMQDAFFDLWVVLPPAPAYQKKTLPVIYRQHELQKRREYGDRVREVEHGAFTPLVVTTGGGAASEATVFLKRLAGMLADKAWTGLFGYYGLVEMCNRILLTAILFDVHPSKSSYERSKCY